jgi:hypothetical protein
MKKDAYYFSHDANSQDDPKCMVLIDQLGMEGYGIFWALIEKLRNEKNYTLPLIVCSSFAKRWGTSKEKVEAVISKYDLFIIENNEFFYSERLKSSMELKSLKALESINKRWKNTSVLQSNTNVLRIDTIKVKESKVKKSIISKIYFNDSIIFDKKIFAEEFNNWDKDKMSYYYDSALRYSNEGNKYVDWISTIKNWAKKDEIQGKLNFNKPKNIIESGLL